MKRSGLMAAAMLAALGAGLNVPGVTLRDAGSGNNRRSTPPRRDTALAREIADHNAEVDRRKAEKRAAMKGKP